MSQRQSGFTLMAFALYDGAVGEYLQPFFCRTVDEAVRRFQLMLTKPEVVETLFSGRAGDFKLYLIGDYQADTAQLSGMHSPTLVEQANDLVQGLAESKHVLNPTADAARESFLERLKLAKGELR